MITDVFLVYVSGSTYIGTSSCDRPPRATFHVPVSKTIDSPFHRREEPLKYKQRELFGRNRFNVSGTDMNASRVTRLGRSPRPRRTKNHAAGYLARDNPSVDKAFRRSRSSGLVRSAHFRRRVFHFRHYTDTASRPRKQWAQRRARYCPYFTPAVPLSLGTERMNDRSAFTDTSSPLRFIRRIIRDRALFPLTAAAASFTLLELQFSSFKVLPHYHITYPVS